MTTFSDEAFLAAYNRLNPKQKEAVDTIEGPVMVIAGPGTGKTQILTLRIANILRQTQMNPENILALTFTKSGAKAMRERLLRFIGVAAYRVPIFTFHGLAERLIREYPEAYTKIIGGKPATEIEKIAIIETILETPELSLLRPTGAPRFYVSPLLSTISHLKQEYVMPDDLAGLIATQEQELEAIPRYHEKGAHKGKERSEYTKQVASIEKQRALLAVYRRYEVLMRERERYDFDDMILETVRVLQENEVVRLDLQETYQYILADEHQDVNGAQNEILVQLTSYHDNPNLFVVGDEKQAIYRFQGASLENFLYFESLFQSTKVIALTDNYRSTQPILDVGHELIAVTEGPLLDYRIPLISATGGEVRDVAIVEYGTEVNEHEALVSRIKESLAKDVPPEEIAVIVRSNREVEQVAEIIEGAGIAVEASADSDILEHPLFLAIVDLLEVVLHPSDMTLLARVCQAPYWGITVPDLVLLLGHVTYDLSLAALMEDEAKLRDIGLLEPAAVSRLVTVLATARNKVAVLPPHRLLASILHESGMYHAVVGDDPLTSARIIRRLYDEVEGFVRNGEALTLSAVVSLLRRRIEYRVPLNAPFVKGSERAVQVMTAHKSKGLEFKVVLIPHVTESVWGGSGRPQQFKVPLMRTATLKLEANEDERRLLYVAMTRAKETLVLSYANVGSDGKVLSPSPFVSILEPQVPVTTVLSGTEEISSVPLPVSTSENKTAVQTVILRILKERGLSATSLNNCIKNPWNFLYRNVLRIPEVQSLSMMFGTAMHGVLETATRERRATGQVPSFSVLREVLRRELGKLPIAPVEFTDLFAKGQEVLAAYLPHLEAALPKDTKEELSIKVIIPLAHELLPELLLTGKLDRIDIGDDGRALRVIDYKTGKYKSRNEIEGKTAKADASYRRQLSFYSLLLSLYDDERYQTEMGVLSFIEPDSKGKIHEEAFQSGEGERQALLAEIEMAVTTLLKGDFLTDEKLLAESDYAHMGKLLIARLNK